MANIGRYNCNNCESIKSQKTQTSEKGKERLGIKKCRIPLYREVINGPTAALSCHANIDALAKNI